ncbi:MAG: RNA polymerase sigma factor [Firmicutes bacterium]|nr:RNA polymerase sigma factor [Bacillota bacterium]
MIIDQSYVDKIKEKDEEAFEYVYLATKRAVYSVIFAVTKDHLSAEDMMQEVYMKMLSSIHQYKENTNFYNWLLQIAHHHSIDHYRKNKNKYNVDINDYSEVLVSKGLRPDEEEQFTEMIERLDEDERIVVILKVVEEMKHREIAKVLKKPLGTIIWIYQKAMNKLKSEGGYENEEE